MRKLSGVIALAVVCGAGLVACGDDSSSSSGGGGSGKTSTPQAYVDGVCTAMTSIIDKAKSAETAFSAGGGDPAKAKQQVQDLIGGMSKAVTDATTKIEALGAPKVTDGAKGHQALLDALKKMSSGLKEVEASAASLDVTSAESAKGFADVADKFSKSMDSLGSGMESLNAKELSDAAKKSDACKKLNA